MTLPAPTYDLVLLLDPAAEEDARAQIVADTRSAVEGGGELLRHDEWGERPLSYPIGRKASAEYHLLQFHAPAELLSELNRTLHIADDVLRFRIVKLKPGVPEAPDMGAARRGESQAERSGETDAGSEAAAEHDVAGAGRGGEAEAGGDAEADRGGEAETRQAEQAEPPPAQDAVGEPA
jgi:small subunit ribosomal protein S6